MHLLIQLVAFCLSIIGVWAALKFHNDKGIDNFYSLHSWLGLACLVLFGVQVCFQIPLSFSLSNFYFLFWQGVVLYILQTKYMHCARGLQLVHVRLCFEVFSADKTCDAAKSDHFKFMCVTRGAYHTYGRPLILIKGH